MILNGSKNNIMQRIKDIKTVHIELTDKCQAQCPMCARNVNGGAPRPFIRNGDISINQFKEWFPKKFLAQLTNFYSCGNYGDPAFAQDCLEIFQYVRDANPTCRLALHTNGGMRNEEWWSKLAPVIGSVSNSNVVFGIDGFEGKHELYRRNTKFSKVIDNMEAFIKAGGVARVDSLVFKHNEDDVETLEYFLLGKGVQEVNFVSTTRFYEMDKFAVQDLDGNYEYDLEPATRPEYKKVPNTTLESLLDKDVRQRAISNAVIKPKCMEDQGIYVDPYGNILSCCLIGSDYLEEPVKETLPIHILRNLTVQNTKDMLTDIGVPNCKDGVLSSDTILWEHMDNYWNGDNKCMTCIKACSKTMYNTTKHIA